MKNYNVIIHRGVLWLATIKLESSSKSLAEQGARLTREVEGSHEEDDDYEAEDADMAAAVLSMYNNPGFARHVDAIAGIA